MPEHTVDDATEPIQVPGVLTGRRRERLPRTSLFVAVVGVIIITILDIMACALIIATSDKDVPDGLIALGGTGLGSLGTFLARGQGTT